MSLLRWQRNFKLKVGLFMLHSDGPVYICQNIAGKLMKAMFRRTDALLARQVRA